MKRRTEEMQDGEHDFIEALADIEHEQWMEWSKLIATRHELDPEVIERWKGFWKPYKELDEAAKELDRRWARIVWEKIKALQKQYWEERKHWGERY